MLIIQRRKIILKLCVTSKVIDEDTRFTLSWVFFGKNSDFIKTLRRNFFYQITINYKVLKGHMRLFYFKSIFKLSKNNNELI